jgi:hypothetical protein
MHGTYNVKMYGSFLFASFGKSYNIMGCYVTRKGLNFKNEHKISESFTAT